MSNFFEQVPDTLKGSLNIILGGFQVASGFSLAKRLTSLSRSNSANPLDGIEYTRKVQRQMKTDDYHGFPRTVKNFGDTAKVTKIRGGDGLIRTKVEIPGSYRGKKGVFEFIIEPDGKTVNHRFFKPNE